MRNHPLPTGELQGDDTPVKHVGTGTGVSDSYGASLSPNATNRRQSITSMTRSTPPFEMDSNDTVKDGDE